MLGAMRNAFKVSCHFILQELYVFGVIIPISQTQKVIFKEVNKMKIKS